MSLGFFSSSELTVRKPQPTLIPRCGSCGLYKNCHSPKMPIFGNGSKKILILGEAPGSTEDRLGRPFCGQSGDVLQNVLSKVGVSLSEDCWVTNSLICHPKETKNGVTKNRTPTDAEISHCRPNVIRAVKELQPEIIIPLGTSAVKSLIGWLWKEDVGPIGRWVGWQIPHIGLNAWLTPTWHPSYVMRNERGKTDEVVSLLFERHLKSACELKGRPYFQIPTHVGVNRCPTTATASRPRFPHACGGEPLPDYCHRVKTTVLADDAVAEVENFIKIGRPVAFDLETDRLKPDPEDSRIVCCSVSDGYWSVAFPWLAKTRDVMQALIRSDLPKIGYNQKFEERWCRKEFGHGVTNWVFDGMLAAHTLDNRSGICSLKFQAFCLLGVDSWDDHIKPYLESKGSNLPNRIGEVALDQLLNYCAYDSMYEFHVARKQAEQLGVQLG